MTLLDRLPREFKRKCEGISTERRDLLGLRAFDPLPADALAASLNATFFTPEQLPSLAAAHVAALYATDTWSAAVICHNPVWIVHRPDRAPTRREADLMHELAHVLLQHVMVGFDPVSGLPQRRQVDEDEATYLGSCLQIPHRGLLWAVQRNMPIEGIAMHFGASVAVVQLRSNALGVRLGRVLDAR